MVVSELKRQKTFSYPLMCDIFQKFGPEIAEDLVVLLKDKRTADNIKIPALKILGKIGGAKYVNTVLIPLCNHKNNDLRAMAFWALANCWTALSPKLLLQGKNDPYWLVRQYTADCALHSSPISVDILTSLLGDENWLVSLHSAQSLFDSGESGQKLLHSLSKKRSLSGKRAKMILEEKGGKYAVV
jgi:HEAT repeat protein